MLNVDIYYSGGVWSTYNSMNVELIVCLCAENILPLPPTCCASYVWDRLDGGRNIHAKMVELQTHICGLTDNAIVERLSPTNAKKAILSCCKEHFVGWWPSKLTAFARSSNALIRIVLTSVVILSRTMWFHCHFHHRLDAPCCHGPLSVVRKLLLMHINTK